MAKRTSWKSMVGMVLTTGMPDEREADIVLPIAPTMKQVTHEGHRYWRADGITQHDDDGVMAVYLRSDYGARMMERHKNGEGA